MQLVSRLVAGFSYLVETFKEFFVPLREGDLEQHFAELPCLLWRERQAGGRKFERASQRLFVLTASSKFQMCEPSIQAFRCYGRLFYRNGTGVFPEKHVCGTARSHVNF